MFASLYRPSYRSSYRSPLSLVFGLTVAAWGPMGFAQMDPASPAVAHPAHPAHATTPARRNLLPQPLHNGEFKEGHHMNLEVVVQTGQVYLYAQDKMGQPVPSQKLKMKATVQALEEEAPIPEPVRDLSKPPPSPTPRPAGHAPVFPKTDLVLQPDTDHFAGRIDLRVKYELVVEASPQADAKAKPETFKFTIRP